MTPQICVRSPCPNLVSSMIAFDAEDGRGEMGAVCSHHHLPRKPTEGPGGRATSPRSCDPKAALGPNQAPSCPQSLFGTLSLISPVGGLALCPPPEHPPATASSSPLPRRRSKLGGRFCPRSSLSGHQKSLEGVLGSSVVECLPLAQVIIGSWDRVPH